MDRKQIETVVNLLTHEIKRDLAFRVRHKAPTTEKFLHASSSDVKGFFVDVASQTLDASATLIIEALDKLLVSPDELPTQE